MEEGEVSTKKTEMLWDVATTLLLLLMMMMMYYIFFLFEHPLFLVMGSVKHNMTEGSIVHFTGRLHLCCCTVAVATVTTTTIAATAASTTSSTVIFAAITTSMAVYTNLTKPRLTAATLSAAACNAFLPSSPLPHAFVAFTFSVNVCEDYDTSQCPILRSCASCVCIFCSVRRVEISRSLSKNPLEQLSYIQNLVTT